MGKFSSPGKIHLIGEHSVVYGKPAILTAINKRTFCDTERSDKTQIISEGFGKFSGNLSDACEFASKMEDLHKNGSFDEMFSQSRNTPENSLKVLLGKSSKELQIEDNFSVRIDSQIIPNSGLGSSAALSVAFVKSAADLFSVEISDKRLYEVSLSIEKIFHGKPSGADSVVCQNGGTIWFEDGNYEKIKSQRLELILIHTERESTTGEMVQKVRNMEDKKRTNIIEMLGDLTFSMRDALDSGDIKNIITIFNSAQRHLASLGISTKKTDNICSIVTGFGGGAKISGAGGGGHVIAIHENLDSLESHLRKNGYNPLKVTIGEEGLRRED